jgi:hypothetical protein
MPMRFLSTLVACVLLAVAASAQSRITQGSAATGNTLKQDLYFKLCNLDPAMVDLDAKEISNSMTGVTSGLGASLRCIGRGGTVDGSPACTVRAQECTALGGTSCADITGDLTIAALDTSYTAAYTDSSWTAGAWLQIAVTSGLTSAGDCPTCVYCRIVGTW